MCELPTIWSDIGGSFFEDVKRTVISDTVIIDSARKSDVVIETESSIAVQYMRTGQQKIMEIYQNTSKLTPTQ